MYAGRISGFPLPGRYCDDMITYKNDKIIDPKQLFLLFKSVDWIRPSAEKTGTENTESRDSIANHIYYMDYSPDNELLTKAFSNSTYVYSAWDNHRLAGVIRVISDSIQRSVLYDFIVHPDYQGQGIGKKLLKTCLNKYRHTQITLGTSSHNFRFYEKFGFRRSHNYLEIASKAF